jgi:hypothetical protein
MANDSSCPICCEKAAAMSSCVNSDKCKVAACLACWRRWPAGACDTTYDRKTVARMGGKTWQGKELKQHKQRLLQEQHKARLPVLQEAIRRMLVAKAIVNRVGEIDQERGKLKRLRQELSARAEALVGRGGGIRAQRNADAVDELGAEAVDAMSS